MVCMKSKKCSIQCLTVVLKIKEKLNANLLQRTKDAAEMGLSARQPLAYTSADLILFESL